MYRSLMVLAAADGIAFGVGNLLLPDIVLSILGGELNALGRSVFQTLGAAILGYGVVAWFLRKLEDGPMRRGVIVGVVISFVAIAVVVGLAALSGLVNLLAWAVVAIHAAVATGLLLVLLRPAAPAVTSG
jgi:apolipoprotein N-acyltransferase